MLTEKKSCSFVRGKPLKYYFYLDSIFDKKPKHYYAFRCSEHVSFYDVENRIQDTDYCLYNGYYIDCMDDPFFNDNYESWVELYEG